jgi:hypothetical protein
MMQFTAEQVNNILAQEKDTYIWQITHKIKADKQLTLPDEEIKDLFNRLKTTYDYLLNLGFSKKFLIEAFLYAEATNPNIKDQPRLKAWIEKKNENPEKQFEDLLFIANKIQ